MTLGSGGCFCYVALALFVFLKLVPLQNDITRTFGSILSLLCHCHRLVVLPRLMGLLDRACVDRAALDYPIVDLVIMLP